MKLEDFFSKYDKETVKKHFSSYISDDKWDKNKNLFMFFFVISKEKNLPRCFINDNLHMIDSMDVDDKEKEYQYWRVFSQVIFNYELGDKLFVEYGDKVDFDSISRREDMTLEFFNKHKDKIKLSNVRANLGSDFINENLLELDNALLKKVKLSWEQAKILIDNKKMSYIDFSNQAFFDKEFVLKNIKNSSIHRHIDNLHQRFNFNFAEMMSILNGLDDRMDDEEYNQVIVMFLDDDKLSLEQKKDIKYMAIL